MRSIRFAWMQLHAAQCAAVDAAMDAAREGRHKDTALLCAPTAHGEVSRPRTLAAA
jgi:hypothetical protein